VYRQDRIKQMSEPNSLRLGHEAEEITIAVETPGATQLYDFEAGFIMTVKQLVGQLPVRSFVGKFKRLCTMPLDSDYCDKAVGPDSSYRGIGSQIFKLVHPWEYPSL